VTNFVSNIKQICREFNLGNLGCAWWWKWKLITVEGLANLVNFTLIGNAGTEMQLNNLESESQECDYMVKECCGIICYNM